MLLGWVLSIVAIEVANRCVVVIEAVQVVAIVDQDAFVVDRLSVDGCGRWPLVDWTLVAALARQGDDHPDNKAKPRSHKEPCCDIDPVIPPEAMSNLSIANSHSRVGEIRTPEFHAPKACALPLGHHPPHFPATRKATVIAAPIGVLYYWNRGRGTIMTLGGLILLVLLIIILIWIFT